ncbi:hypothetical protein [Desulforamulus profundi]|uniref:hypothetical protein n=1 Tax=Desulforamulus profundi TaxID=1383067 RepID=UPI001EE62940|nr:hypothetical protein [Desulforamulus profundi]
MPACCTNGERRSPWWTWILSVTGLVSNTNLSHHTDAQVMVEGYGKVSEMAARLGLPVAFLASPGPLERKLKQSYRGFPFCLEFYMKTPWEEAFGEG